ncbi:hypothetical protein M409DRAFT_29911 [Zasmidium cellare ATCC 36951]|uniref:MYND-type domain-containing protein n=1 Tax=Zasmidium cellare ATCC 36951 TaxID=1080233 RepID=A0A6A6BXR8_ZASCE|nr:uncharacterized protein M409DRAFT_29911 [Zasmidium cellare ATCC 36951]KAF2159591.1 hypothetical protein M409DRAFT_29911 [Zasmidium cellare ATCC 36951]
MSASPPPMEGPSRNCGHCSAAASQHCAGCRNIKYCDRNWQKKDWHLHKHLCKTFADFAEPPGPNLRRIIILPESSDKPHFAWMETYKVEGREDYEDPDSINDKLGVRYYDQEEGGEMSEFGGIFGENSSVDYALDIVLGKRCNGELLDHSLNMLCGCDTCPVNLNKCLDNLTSGHAKSMGVLGRGDKAIFATSNVVESMFVRDADCSDLTLAIKGWVAYEELSRRQRAAMRTLNHPGYIDMEKMEEMEEMFRAKAQSKQQHNSD